MLSTSLVIERYSGNGFPCYWGTRMSGWRRYSLISLKAFWHSLFRLWGSFFRKSLKMGLQVEVSLVMNRLMYYSQPRNPLISFLLLGGGISNIALILGGSTLIPLSLTKKPSNFAAVTPKVHFWGFNLNLYSLILSKNFLKLMVWPLSILGFHDRVINIHLNLIVHQSCNKAMSILW